MNMVSYERIKNSIEIDFEEYIEEEGLNIVQVSTKILEEDWQRVNASLFTKTLYFVSIAIESMKYNEIADFIYTKLDNYFEDIKLEETIKEKDFELLLQDIELCKELMEKQQFNILETDESNKAGVNYILNLKLN